MTISVPKSPSRCFLRTRYRLQRHQRSLDCGHFSQLCLFCSFLAPSPPRPPNHTAIETPVLIPPPSPRSQAGNPTCAPQMVHASPAASAVCSLVTETKLVLSEPITICAAGHVTDASMQSLLKLSSHYVQHCPIPMPTPCNVYSPENQPSVHHPSIRC